MITFKKTYRRPLDPPRRPRWGAATRSVSGSTLLPRSRAFSHCVGQYVSPSAAAHRGGGQSRTRCESRASRRRCINIESSWLGARRAARTAHCCCHRAVATSCRRPSAARTSDAAAAHRRSAAGSGSASSGGSGGAKPRSDGAEEGGGGTPRWS
jgi:hypothetical protein